MKKYTPFILVILIIIGISFQGYSLYAQENNKLNQETETTEEMNLEFDPSSQEEQVLKEAEKTHEFKNQLKKIDSSLISSHYSDALAYIQALYNKVKERQEADIDRFFPISFKGYKVRRAFSSIDEFEESNYGVIFTKSFKDKRGRTIDVNVIYSDDSIQEYERIINNPNLIKGIDNAKIVTLFKKYKAIQKSSAEQNFFEENIIVNRDLLINIIGVGMSDIIILESFSKMIDIPALELYLK